MDTHRKLPVWQQARRLVGSVYKLTRELPREERYVVVPQLRRAAWSVPSNIAEGNAKYGRGELRRYLDCALGSLGEIDSFVITLGDLYGLDQVTVAEVDALRQDITRGIFGILRRPGR